MERFSRTLAASLVLVAAAFTSVAVADDDLQPKPINALFGFSSDEPVVIQPGSPPVLIGIGMVPASDVLKTHLDIEGGIVVGHVMDKSPAAKAGIQQHDVITHFAGQPIAGPADLSAAVLKSGLQEVEVKVIRKGKQQTLKVTPLVAKTLTELEGKDDDNRKEVNRLFSEMIKKHGEHISDRMLWVEPLILDAGKHAHGANEQLPGAVSVTVYEEDEEPAKIKIKIGDKEWNTSEDKFDDLPEEVQNRVRSILIHTGKLRVNGLQLRIKNDATNDTAPAEATRIMRIHRSAEAAATAGASDALEQIRKSQEELKKAIDRIHREIAELKSEE